VLDRDKVDVRRAVPNGERLLVGERD